MWLCARVCVSTYRLTNLPLLHWIWLGNYLNKHLVCCLRWRRRECQRLRLPLYCSGHSSLAIFQWGAFRVSFFFFLFVGHTQLSLPKLRFFFVIYSPFFPLFNNLLLHLCMCVWVCLQLCQRWLLFNLRFAWSFLLLQNLCVNYGQWEWVYTRDSIQFTCFRFDLRSHVL